MNVLPLDRDETLGFLSFDDDIDELMRIGEAAAAGERYLTPIELSVGIDELLAISEQATQGRGYGLPASTIPKTTTAVDTTSKPPQKSWEQWIKDNQLPLMVGAVGIVLLLRR